MKFRQLITTTRVSGGDKTHEVRTRRGVQHEPDLNITEGEREWHEFGWIETTWRGPIRNDPETFRAYTGKNDVRGVEIYAGSIVKLQCVWPNKEGKQVTATIEWSDELAGFIVAIHDKKILNVHGKEVSYGEYHNYAGSHRCFSFESYMEVIGNTDENPELLT
jgi:uncharacterized phage protein (TIGR01671 family)